MYTQTCLVLGIHNLAHRTQRTAGYKGGFSCGRSCPIPCLRGQPGVMVNWSSHGSLQDTSSHRLRPLSISAPHLGLEIKGLHLTRVL